MAQHKNIVICLDGTGNQFEEHNSNVVKLYRVLKHGPEEQLVYYDPGVGTLADPAFRTPIAKKVNKGLGLAFGRGLTRNIVEAYSFLMDHHDEGDRIYLFGFSRGAYTARAVAGFIHRCGLLEEGCQNLIPYAMKLYKQADFEVCGKFKATYATSCDIQFLGLWDTVTTFGWVYDPVDLPNTTNNESVRSVRHAMAIDERRAFFRQNHWGREHRDNQDVKEVWFAGVHSDVGGGYPESESGLAKLALKWIIDEARDSFALLVDSELFDRVVLGKVPTDRYVGPSHTAQQHESLKGPWKVAEYLPQRKWDPKSRRKKLRRPTPSRPRPIADGSTLHQSVLKRMQDVNYTPANLPVLSEIPGRFEIEGP